MIVVYRSHTGSAEKYAKAFALEIGCEAFSVDEEYPAGEAIVFFGWLMKDSVGGLGGIDRIRLKAVCVVGLDAPEAFDSRRIADRNDVKVPIYYLRGWIDRKKLNPLDKAVLVFVAAAMKLRGLDARTGPLFNAIMEGGSFYDESYLDAPLKFCGKK